MTEKRQFTPVQSRVEKYQTYRECMGRYSRAMRSGFFFEALLIDYAMIEDRLRSFLWHAGAFNRWEDKTAFCKKAASRELKALVEANWPGCPKAISLDKLSHKIGAVRAIAVWSSETPRNPDDSAYLNALRGQCESLDAAALLSALRRLEDWSKARNEIIHSLLNKQTHDVAERIESLACQGMELARELDGQVAILKRGERVRKAAYLQARRG